MSEELNRDIVDGKIINWSDLTLDELAKLREEYEQREQEIRNEIDKRLSD